MLRIWDFKKSFKQQILLSVLYDLDEIISIVVPACAFFNKFDIKNEYPDFFSTKYEDKIFL